MADPYKVLGVPKTASDEEIKKAYRRLAKRLHPDLNPGNKKVEPQFRELTAAYDFISDPENRRRYDRGEIDETGTLRPAFWASRDAGARGGGAGRGGRPHDAGLDPDEDDLFRDFFGFGKGQHARKIFQSDRYTGRSTDARTRHCRKYLGQTFLQFGKIEVAVGVDQHRRFRACESAWTTA